jgi:hypothetical protein
MLKPVMLDSWPLRRIADPRPNPEIVAWLNQLLDANAIIATENVRLLSLFVEARHWKDIAGRQ